MPQPEFTVAAMILAAGAGRRMGAPKALITDSHGTTWLARTGDLAAQAGCRPVVAVTGSAAAEVAATVRGRPITVVRNPHWEAGIGTSLLTGLDALVEVEFDALAILLVDTPSTTADVLRRVLSNATPTSLRRASYDGRPGHPVLIGRAHLTPLRALLAPADGARRYLAANDVDQIECADLADGADADVPEQLPAGHRLP